jgi:hypothetical protein
VDVLSANLAPFVCRLSLSEIWRCVRSCPLSGASSLVLVISGFPSSFSGSSPTSPPVPARGLLPLIRGTFWTAAWMRSAWTVRLALLGCTGHVFCMGWLAPLQPAGVVALSRCCWGRGFIRSCLPSPSTRLLCRTVLRGSPCLDGASFGCTNGVGSDMLADIGRERRPRILRADSSRGFFLAEMANFRGVVKLLDHARLCCRWYPEEWWIRSAPEVPVANHVMLRESCVTWSLGSGFGDGLLPPHNLRELGVVELGQFHPVGERRDVGCCRRRGSHDRGCWVDLSGVGCRVDVDCHGAECCFGLLSSGCTWGLRSTAI